MLWRLVGARKRPECSESAVQQTGFESGKRASGSRKCLPEKTWIHLSYSPWPIISLSLSSFARRSGCVWSCVHARIGRNQASTRFMRTHFFSLRQLFIRNGRRYGIGNHSKWITVCVFISFFFAQKRTDDYCEWDTSKSEKNNLMRWRPNKIVSKSRAIDIVAELLIFDIFFLFVLFAFLLCWACCAHINEMKSI